MYLDALEQGFVATFAPATLGGVAIGLVLGLLFGAIPGLNGVIGIVLILPFLWGADPYVAFAILLSLLSAVQTSNTFPAFYFNVPGTPTAAATIIDGYPMAKKGEAAKGLVAAFAASAVGGIVAALIVFLSLPVLRTVVLQVASPERFILVFLGLLSVSVLCGARVSRGLIACAAGLLLGTVGQDPQIGALRYTFGTEYLLDGINLIPLVIGLFAFPEVLSLAVRGQIVDAPDMKLNDGLKPGLLAVWKHKWLTLGGSMLGTLIGAVPGLGGTAAAFYAYAMAVSTARRDDRGQFGKGDVRGVIAPESANNASAAGELIPLLAFGIPGGAASALLLSAFLIVGIVPGTPMFNEHLPLTFSMIFVLVLSNILATIVCILVARWTAPIAAIRAPVLIPILLAFVLFGGYAGLPTANTLLVTFLFGMMGYAMLRADWPRVPLLVGFILGPLVENSLFVSVESYGAAFLLRPFPAAMIVMAMLCAGFVFLRRRWVDGPSAG